MIQSICSKLDALTVSTQMYIYIYIKYSGSSVNNFISFRKVLRQVEYLK